MPFSYDLQSITGSCPKGSGKEDVLSVLFTARLWWDRHLWSVSSSTPACRGAPARTWTVMGVLLSWLVHPFRL